MNHFLKLKRTSQLCRIMFHLPHPCIKNSIFFETRAAHSACISLPEENPDADSNTPIRFSRAARTQAQKALLDYLHSTRGLQFTDAEPMSRNSPIFLQKLLASVENGQDVSRSLTRFLRYHPINEFEPFFESMGLKPSEFSSLLPRDLMFLSDDTVLLDNFHALCNYGIPRGKIGKIYKEETPMFKYEHGVLASKLDDYEKLGLGKTSVIKLVTCCPSLLVGDVDEKLVQLLDGLKNLGIEYDWIGGCLTEKNVYDWNKMLGLLDFFYQTSWSEKETGIFIRKHPGMLLDGSGRKAYVLIGLLMKLGIAMNEILSLFSKFPRGNFIKNLLEGIHFLIAIEMESEYIAGIVHTHMQVLGSCSLKKPTSVLCALNIGKRRLCAIILEDPNQLTKWAMGSKINPLPNTGEDERSLQEKTKFLLKLGFVENSKEMKKALKAFRGKGDELQDRYDWFVKVGFDCSDVSNMIKQSPYVLNQSLDVLQRKMDFLVNNLGYPLESLVAFPACLSYDIERVKLRYSMYNWLKERGKVRPMLALSTILASSDSQFMKTYVKPYSEGPEVWESFKNALYSK